jgi:hypothetical protein
MIAISKCKPKHKINRYSEPKPKTEIKAKHIGARSELTAAAWLLDRGYDVFRNVSAHGVIDLIGIKNGKVHFFDAKSAGNSGGINPEAKQLGVKRIIVNGVCEIKISSKLN